MQQPRRQLAGLAAGLVLGVTPAQVVPLLLGAAVRSGASLGLAGTLATVELGCLALVSWLAGALAGRDRAPLWWPRVGFALAVAAQGGSALLALDGGGLPTAPLVLLRAATGCGEGLVVAFVYQRLASGAGARQLYGRALQLVILLSVVVLPLLAALLARGLGAVYAALAVGSALMGLICLLGVRSEQRPSPAGAGPVRRRGGPSPALAAVAVVGAGLVAFGDGVVYAFVERISVLRDATGWVGWLLCGSSLTGALGAGLARRDGVTRQGVATALAAGLVVTAVAALLVASTPSTLLYALGVLLKGASYFFALTLLLGAVATWPTDAVRWPSLVGGVVPLCASLGPVLGALLVERTGLGVPALGWISASASLAGLLAFGPVLRGGGAPD